MPAAPANGCAKTAETCSVIISRCKRRSGSGFTRKENLHEHIRRVHRRVSGSLDVGNAAAKAKEEVKTTPATEKMTYWNDEDKKHERKKNKNGIVNRIKGGFMSLFEDVEEERSN